MSNQVITISREFGSGGRQLGQMLARELGWSFYDREILRLASDDSGISESFFARADETTRKTRLFRIASNIFDGKVIPPESDDFTSNENLFRYQAKIIRELADSENCVIIGRCANYILKDRPNVLRLYVHAPMDVRIRTVMRRDGMMQDEAARLIRDTDKKRGEYYRYFTGADWRNADQYDLCADSSKLESDRLLTIIRSILDSIK